MKGSLNNPSGKPKALALIQARMRSTRLPGKVLAPLGEKCVLRRLLDRMARAGSVDLTVVATSDHLMDDELARVCREWNVPVFRGSESDVLGRFVAAARAFDAEWIVRVNSDNPLLDPRYIDELMAAVWGENVDYASYRRGDGRPVMLTALSFFAEAISRECLERSDREIMDPSEREHVTLGIYSRSERFVVRWLDVPSFCNDPRLRFTVDTQADLDLLREIYTVLGDRASMAGADEVVRLALECPKWLEQMAAANAAHPKARSS